MMISFAIETLVKIEIVKYYFDNLYANFFSYGLRKPLHSHQQITRSKVFENFIKISFKNKYT